MTRGGSAEGELYLAALWNKMAKPAVWRGTFPRPLSFGRHHGSSGYTPFCREFGLP